MLGDGIGGQHPGRVALLDDAAPGQQGHSVAVAGGQGQVVQGGDDGEGGLGPQFLHQLQHVLLVAEVQGGGRLVQQQDRGLLGQGPGQHGPLALPARQGPQLSFGQRAQVEPVEHLARHRQVAGAVAGEDAPVGGAAQQDVVDHRHPRGDDRGLGHVGQRPGPGGGAAVGGQARHPDGAGGGRRAQNRSQQGGLARPVGADHVQPLPGGHL